MGCSVTGVKPKVSPKSCVERNVLPGWSFAFEIGSKTRNGGNEIECVRFPSSVFAWIDSGVLFLFGTDLYVDQRQNLPEELGFVIFDS